MKVTPDQRLDRELLEKVIQRFQERASGPIAREVVQHQFRKELDLRGRIKYHAAETLAKFILSLWNPVLSDTQASFQARGLEDAVARLQSERTHQRQYAEEQVADAVTPVLFSEIPEVYQAWDLDDWLSHRNASLRTWRSQIQNLDEVRVIWELGLSDEAEALIEAKQQQEAEAIIKAPEPLEQQLQELLPKTKQDDAARAQFVELLELSGFDSARYRYWRRKLSQELS